MINQTEKQVETILRFGLIKDVGYFVAAVIVITDYVFSPVFVVEKAVAIGVVAAVVAMVVTWRVLPRIRL